MQLCTAIHDLAHRAHVARLQSRRESFDFREPVGVFEQADLYGFGDTAAPFAIAERLEERGVVDDRRGWREGADEVLLAEGIDAVLDANARVALCEDRRGYPDQSDTAMGGP